MTEKEFYTIVARQTDSLMEQSKTTNILFLNSDDITGKGVAAREFAKNCGIGVILEFPFYFDWDKNSDNFVSAIQGTYPEVIIVGLHASAETGYSEKCKRAFEFVKQTCHLANPNKKIVVLASKEQMAE